MDINDKGTSKLYSLILHFFLNEGFAFAKQNIIAHKWSKRFHNENGVKLYVTHLNYLICGISLN